jgi:hypothetical protein
MSQTATTTVSNTRHSFSHANGIELGRLDSWSSAAAKPATQDIAHAEQGRTSGTDPGAGAGTGVGGAILGDDEPPASAQGEIERWNRPRRNVGKLGFAFLSFIIAGMNDASIGVSDPGLRTTP